MQIDVHVLLDELLLQINELSDILLHLIYEEIINRVHFPHELLHPAIQKDFGL